MKQVKSCCLFWLLMRLQYVISGLRRKTFTNKLVNQRNGIVLLLSEELFRCVCDAWSWWSPVIEGKVFGWKKEVF